MPGWLRAGRHERAGFALYTEAVGAARDPAWFGPIGVPDTIDGRFDLIGVFVALLLRRLRRLAAPGPALAQSVFDAMFADLDHQLREMGVGEMSVPRRMRDMWEALHGRAMAYEPAIDAGDAGALEQALRRNVWRGDGAGDSATLARHALAEAESLDGQDLAAFRAGRVRFLPAPTAPHPSE